MVGVGRARIFDDGRCKVHKSVAPLHDGGNVTTQSLCVLEFRALIDCSFVSACGAFAQSFLSDCAALIDDLED